jgi:uncharacterized repeat protein (TIGR04052 family)
VRFAALFAALAIAGCDPAEITLSFEGLVGGEPARCGQSYAGIGTTDSELTLGDFRLFVHDIRVVNASGEEIPLSLEQDGVWQHEDLALLDFEDGDGCESGTAETNTTVRGTIPGESPPLVGVRMRLGVPFELNHGDASTAPSPLSFTSMFWSWNGGYKFLRVDARTTGLPSGFLLHLGSTGCEGDGRGGVTSCTQENRAEIALDGFDPRTRTISIDLAELLSESDVDADLGGQPGCMSGWGDPDCEPIFHALGLPFDGTPAPGPQRFFAIGGE